MVDTSTEEFLDADLNDIGTHFIYALVVTCLENSGNLYTKLEQRLNESIVDRVALTLSKENLDDKAQHELNPNFNPASERKKLLMVADPYFSPMSDLE